MIRLSPQECAVLVRLAKGESFKWIATVEFTTETAARQAAHRAYLKLGVHSATEAVQIHHHRRHPSRGCFVRVTNQ